MGWRERLRRPAAIVFAVFAATGAIVSIPFGLLLYRQLAYSGYQCTLEAPGYGTLEAERISVFPLGLACDWLIDSIPTTVVIANWPLTIVVLVTLISLAALLVAMSRGRRRPVARWSQA